VYGIGHGFAIIEVTTHATDIFWWTDSFTFQVYRVPVSKVLTPAVESQHVRKNDCYW